MSKRLFLYFFLFSIAVAFVGQIYADSPVVHAHKDQSYKGQINPKANFTGAQKAYEFSKFELVFDNDNEENEIGQDFSKNQTNPIHLPIAVPLFSKWVTSTCCYQANNHDYFSEHSSRLPRYNFITLRVLRL